MAWNVYTEGELHWQSLVIARTTVNDSRECDPSLYNSRSVGIPSKGPFNVALTTSTFRMLQIFQTRFESVNAGRPCGEVTRKENEFAAAAGGPRSAVLRGTIEAVSRRLRSCVENICIQGDQHHRRKILIAQPSNSQGVPQTCIQRKSKRALSVGYHKPKVQSSLLPCRAFSPLLPMSIFLESS